MMSFTSFSKHLLTGVSATGQSFKVVILLVFGTGTMIDDLKLLGTTGV